jgi:hypothetical protein
MSEISLGKRSKIGLVTDFVFMAVIYNITILTNRLQHWAPTVSFAANCAFWFCDRQLPQIL